MRHRYDLLAISLLIFAAALVAWTGIFGPLDKGAVGFIEKWQGMIGALLGATGTIVAGWLAWRAGMKTLRFEMLTRSEERLERDLPGLRQAQNFCAHMLAEIKNPLGAIHALNLSRPAEEIRTKIPLASGLLQQQISDVLHNAVVNHAILRNALAHRGAARATHANSASTDNAAALKFAETQTEKAQTRSHRADKSFERLFVELSADVNRSYARLRSVRSKIEDALARDAF